MNNSLEKRHQTCEAELTAALASIEKMRETLTDARRTAFALESQNGKGDDAAIGRARRQITRSEKALLDLGARHAKLAAEELGARYAAVEERQREARATGEELGKRETSLVDRLAATAPQLAEAEARLGERGATGRRLMAGPLRAHVEGQAKEALAAVTKIKRKIRELEADLVKARAGRRDATAGLAFAAAELEGLLTAGETYLRVLSLEKLDAQLADPHVTVDRGAVAELVARWANEGFTAWVEPPLAAPVKLTFHPRVASIYYWFHTGAIAATAIFDCPSETGSEQWPKRLDPAFFDDPRERLEREAAP
jgi:predicted  nucleic acid-binding Zn-ribbon protein